MNTLLLQDVLADDEWSELLTAEERRQTVPESTATSSPDRRGLTGRAGQPGRGVSELAFQLPVPPALNR